jgi:APA family basic amino acid/polyamine antiporter
LLELAGFNLHDQANRGRDAPKARTDMAAAEAGGAAALPGRITAGGGSTVSLWVAAAIVVADMVGVGVFTSLGFQVKDIPSGFSILLLWMLGGIVALCGVFSYGELSAMFPRSSGEYNFLGRTYHPAFGFVAGWVSATVGFSAPVALAAMAFGEYGRSILPEAPPLALAVAMVWAVSLVQLTGVRHSATFQMVATILKVVLIVAFLACGFVIGTAQPVSFAPQSSDFSYVLSAPFAISLVFVMYSFSGWNAATYIIGEMKLPERNVPRAMLIGTLIVLVLYVALNAVFLHTAPIAELVGKVDVARISGSHIFGELGGRIVGGMICIGLISSVSAMMWIGPRVMMTMGEDIPALKIFARRSQNGAPAYAILFQLAVASLMLFTRSFEAVLEFIQFSLLFCSFFVVLGVIKLRITHPDLPRP